MEYSRICQFCGREASRPYSSFPAVGLACPDCRAKDPATLRIPTHTFKEISNRLRDGTSNMVIYKCWRCGQEKIWKKGDLEYIVQERCPGLPVGWPR